MSTSCANKAYGATPVLSLYQQINEPTKSWNTSPIITTVSTDQFWEENAEENIKNKVNSIKSKFHQERKLLVKHLPRNVVKQEIAQLLNDFAIKYINITSSEDTSGTATVTLEDPAILDEWNTERTFKLRGQSVSVSPTPTEMLLCVARLPFHYGEEDFYDLIKNYGEIKTYFLMISEKTGQSKGYGFVHYANKEHALVARNALNDKIIDTHRLVCDWLDSSHLTLKSLHSKCLYVDKLPSNFRDMGEFREVFAKVVNPPYCQIALKNGCPLDWGLVEYLTAEDAEKAQTTCNNYVLRNQPIRVVYYIPGVRAINLYLSLMNDTPSRGKSAGLLPDPSGQHIMRSIQNLSKQNPIFAQELKNIILHQLQESKHLKDGDDLKPSTGGKIADSKIVDRMPPSKNGKLDKEKIVPSPPPVATVVNTLPIINTNCNGFVPVSQALPILPNTAVPPPVVEKLTFNRPLSVNVKDKSHCFNPQLFWNDVLGQTFPGNAYSPILPTIPVESATPPVFTMAPTQIPSNFVHEIMSRPLNFQQHILNIINNSSPTPQPIPPISNVSPVSPPANVFPTLNPTLDATWSFPNVQDTLISSHIPQPFLTLPMSKTVLPNGWTSIPTFIPHTTIPTMFTTDWQTTMPPNIMVSQASTPIMHHGQKRKLLPSPEKSPEGSYIGQHSQGIGGHYADSYFKKKKMF